MLRAWADGVFCDVELLITSWVSWECTAECVCVGGWGGVRDNIKNSLMASTMYLAAYIRERE